jgi:hypothetical protein
MNINSSKGERKIEDILKQNKISFQREVSFNDLHGSGNNLLRFDFAIFKQDQLICLIEYDGEQHFKFVKHFHKNVFNFKKAKEWDRRKNRYCLIHNIPLIRVPYWDYDTLTFKKIFTESSYRVTTKYHNDNLIKR